MKKFLACLLLCSITTVMFAAEEQVVNLPQDQTKWYISVVGEKGPAYDNLIAQFEQGKLKQLKNQCHFCPVTTDTAIYAERYKNSIKGLPTVRVQEADGAVVYEAAGKSIPDSIAGLYDSIVSAIQRRELLPWRRNHSRPQPSPQPSPQPIFTDPAPQPLNGGGAPEVIESVSPVDVGIGICLVMLVIGIIAGEIAASKTLHAEQVKGG